MSGPLRSRNSSPSQRNLRQDSICGHMRYTVDQPSKSNNRTEFQKLRCTARYHCSGAKDCLVTISAVYVSVAIGLANHTETLVCECARLMPYPAEVRRSEMQKLQPPIAVHCGNNETRRRHPASRSSSRTHCDRNAHMLKFRHS